MKINKIPGELVKPFLYLAKKNKNAIAIQIQLHPAMLAFIVSEFRSSKIDSDFELRFILSKAQDRTQIIMKAVNKERSYVG